MNISLRLLRYVTAAAECGNVTEAARSLQVSQPSVSAAIAELEQMLGITIFVRHHAKGVTLTPAGQRLVQEARQLLHHASEFSRMAESLGGAGRGEIAVGCVHALAARFMPTLIAEFSRLHPAISLELEEGDQEQLMRGLAQGRIEAAIAFGDGVPAGIETKLLLELPPFAVLSEDHPLAGEQDVSLAGLEQEPLILCENGGYVLSLFEGQKLRPRIAAQLKSFELVRGLVARGRGYAIGTVAPLTTAACDGGRVAGKPLRDKLPPARVVCALPGSHAARPAVQTFVTFLADALQSAQQSAVA